MALTALLLSCNAVRALPEDKQRMPGPVDGKMAPDGNNHSSYGTMSPKDGAGKAGRDLTLLHEEYLDYLKRAGATGKRGEDFRPSNPLVRVITGTVIIDATASGDPEELAAALSGLGAQKITVFGRKISCRFPIAAIPALNGLSELHSARPSYAARNPG